MENNEMKVTLSNVTVEPMSESLNVKVTDIDMSFMSMVVFMVRLVFAMIPAMIIISVIMMVLV